MDFDLTKELRDIQKAAREFAKGEFDPDAALEYDQNQEFPSTIWKKACELGFIGMHVPEEYGGQGLGLLENVLITEEFCRQDSGMGIALALSDFGSELVLRHGNENQKSKILPLITQGESVFTIAILEEGYSLSPLATTANMDKNGYIISGKKEFVTLGSLAKHMIVVCQTRLDDPLAQSVFLVERDAEGVEVSTMGEKVGMRMVPSDQVSFTGVIVPHENRVGEEDRGYYQIKDFFDEMRIETGAMGLGLAQGGLDKALEYSKSREQFGRAIAKFDDIRNKLADMYMDIEMARLIAYKAAWSLDNGRPDNGAILMSKMIATKTAYRVTNDAVQIFGGFGYMKESHIERFYRDARVLELFLEPVQIQRNMLADQIIGKKN
ncbi:MAG: acyl-CoA/acyl-ACP dehydrogenase [Deltaproteobacteria bacterium]|nr:acyl-CoA/acyl-ACP dehydrogenase [Deltaproteobacteria bacterium]MBW1910433.1 acyl-CoA/acyl-ACP dehydrogenase [Deltaproteobacteria bacterium]